MAKTTVSRNPFARQELIRRSYSGDDRHKCAWCGNKHKTMYTYEVETDGGTRGGESKQVCNLSCYKAYYQV